MTDADYIYEIYRARSFSAAAKSLFISQPALSTAVKRTEKNLGIVIFDRSSSPINLTEEGQVYIAAVERIRSIESEMQEQLADLAELRSGRVVVSGENFVSSFILPRIIMEFSARYPGITVEMEEATPLHLRQMLLTEQVDLMVAHDFEEELYGSLPLFEETLLLAVPREFPVNRGLEAYALSREEIGRMGSEEPEKPAVPLSVFADCPFLMMKKGNDMQRRVAALMEREQIEPKIKISLDQLITSYNMACAGMGVAVITDALVRSAEGSGCLFYRIAGEGTRRTMEVGYKRNRYLSRAAKAFIQVAREVYAPGE